MISVNRLIWPVTNTTRAGSKVEADFLIPGTGLTNFYSKFALSSTSIESFYFFYLNFKSEVVAGDMLMSERSSKRKFWTTALAVSLAIGAALPAFSQSASDCAARAERASRDSTSVLGGAAVGAAGGAAIGAIVGNRRDARRGAAIGAVAGGATQAYRQNERYKQVYDDCMRGYYRY